ncbi:hypothetical protein PQQ51_14945 [Paraburkholderia xenovorans]|uniref:hypothetical protein n=1 Tax=Paraburkholderia xenovorans TaxID=36873 RepID=UPI0038BE0940
MPVSQALPPRPATSRVAAGQIAMRDLHARTSIVAVEGDLQLEFRDHSLAWLGDGVPLTSITLHEGERYVTPQRGIVSIGVANTAAAVFVVQSRSIDATPFGLISRAAHELARCVRTRLRRAV